MDIAIGKELDAHSISYYWGLVKDLDDSQKLELVKMLINSVRIGHISSERDEKDKERGFRNLAGCWVNDDGDDDMETIIKAGRESRRGHRDVQSFDE